jgi:hypothetical protein
LRLGGGSLLLFQLVNILRDWTKRIFNPADDRDIVVVRGIAANLYFAQLAL